MAGDDRRSDDLLDRLILDVKALVLLHSTDADFRSLLQSRILNSPDEGVRRFASFLRAGRRPETARLAVIAVGELLLASVLIVMGTVALAPNLVGIGSPQQILNYLLGQVSGYPTDSPVFLYAPFVGFAIGAVLLLSAFYTIRRAALDLKEVGLDVKQGEG